MLFPFLAIAILFSVTQTLDLTKECLSHVPPSLRSGLNVMTREKLQYGLDNNYTVLALWNSENCVSCSNHMWEVYHAIYSFMDEKQVLFPPSSSL